MRLSLDCLRDVLLCVENNTGYQRPISFVDVDYSSSLNGFLEQAKVWPYQEALLCSYTNEEIMYHLKYCISSEMIETDGRFGTQQFTVFDLTPKGHDTVAALRSPAVFEKTKSIAKEIGVHTLSGFCDIAFSVLDGIIRAHLNIS